MRVTPGNVSLVNCGKSSIVISPYFFFIAAASGRLARAARAASETWRACAALGLPSIAFCAARAASSRLCIAGDGAPARRGGMVRCLNSGRMGHELLAMRSRAAFCAASWARAAPCVDIAAAAATPAVAPRRKSRRPTPPWCPCVLTCMSSCLVQPMAARVPRPPIRPSTCSSTARFGPRALRPRALWWRGRRAARAAGPRRFGPEMTRSPGSLYVTQRPAVYLAFVPRWAEGVISCVRCGSAPRMRRASAHTGHLPARGPGTPASGGEVVVDRHCRSHASAQAGISESHQHVRTDQQWTRDVPLGADHGISQRHRG